MTRQARVRPPRHWQVAQWWRANASHEPWVQAQTRDSWDWPTCWGCGWAGDGERRRLTDAAVIRFLVDRLIHGPDWDEDDGDDRQTAITLFPKGLTASGVARRAKRDPEWERAMAWGFATWLERCHLQDHEYDGSGDDPANFVLMCHWCHRRQPPGPTREESLVWLRDRQERRLPGGLLAQAMWASEGWLPPAELAAEFSRSSEQLRHFLARGYYEALDRKGSEP
jgi:hypothetical protein